MRGRFLSFPCNSSRLWVSGLACLLVLIPRLASCVTVGLVLDPLAGDGLTQEWAWALRGGGAEIREIDQKSLVSPPANLDLLIVDSVPLSKTVIEAICRWVHKGGILIYADAQSATQEFTDDGQYLQKPDVIASELFGVRVSAVDWGQRGNYPYVVQSSPILSPLMMGDGLQLGVSGVDQRLRLEATTAEILATSARLSPGPGSWLIRSETPTIFLNDYGKGKVLFLSFSPAQIGACYPLFRQNQAPRDCSGAGNAHALMRWVVPNLLWEVRGLQLPLLFEAPGAKPHAVIITGDVHDKPGDQTQVKMAVEMADLFERLKIPLSYYIVGSAAEHLPADIERLKRQGDLEISSHTSAFKTFYVADKYPGLGPLGILSDLRKANDLLGMPKYPEERQWRISFRSHGWSSDESAWRSFKQEGIGLVFDDVADRLSAGSTYQLPMTWFDGGEQERLRIPLFEKNVVTGQNPFPAGSFIIPQGWRSDIASLASAQPEPCCSKLPYQNYSAYIERWNRVWNRLASVGGLTEVWLWHPGGVGGREAYSEVEGSLLEMRKNADIEFMRGDVVASWRANRERHSIKVKRTASGRIDDISLKTEESSVAMPPGSPEGASTIGYWVIGDLKVRGWASRSWPDPYGRKVTLLTRSLGVGRHE